MLQEQEYMQECNNSLRQDLTAANDEISSLKVSTATLEDTMSLRLTDIRQLEQEIASCHSTIRDVTSRADALAQQLAECKDELRQVLFITPLETAVVATRAPFMQPYASNACHVLFDALLVPSSLCCFLCL
jgi:predicted RNase H-like nuclease (RuvC/YqgF family)